MLMTLQSVHALKWNRGTFSFGNHKLAFLKVASGLTGILDLDMLWTGKPNPFLNSRLTFFILCLCRPCVCAWDTCPSSIFNCTEPGTQNDGFSGFLLLSLAPSLLLWCLDSDSSDSSWFLLKLEPAVFLKLSRATKPLSKSSPPHSLTAANCSEGEKKQGAHFPTSPCNCKDPETNRSDSMFSCGAGPQL